jgi:hypothetical protein
MDEAIYALITSFTAITTEVSDRVFPIIRTQGSDLPAITYRKVSSPRLYDQDGIAMVDQNFDLHVYGKTYGKVEDIITLLEDNLSGASGTFGREIIEYVQIEEIGNDDFIDEEEIYTDSVEIRIRFKG